MTLKELKELIKGKRIDRISGFCDSYEQMIDRCRLDVHNGSVVIDTSDDGDNDDQFESVPKVIDQLLAMPSEYDDYPVLKSGFDNNIDNVMLVRQVISAMFKHSQSDGVGLCLLGREPLRFIDDDDDDDDFLYSESMYHVVIIIEDPRAQKLNEKFTEFIHASCNWPFDIERLDEDMIFFSYFDDATLLSFITDEGTSANLIALISGSFNGVYFTRTPLNSSIDVERLSNDRKGKYYKHYQAIVFPAYIPDEEIMNPNSGLTDIAGSRCYIKECDSNNEMEQFIANHTPDEAVGDLVHRITTRYIDDPITLILE